MAEGRGFHFVGREKERGQLLTCLRENKGCNHVVTGPPGMGSSACVDEVLHEYKESGYPPLDIVDIDCKSIDSDYDFAREIQKKLDISAPLDPSKDLSDYKAIAGALVECVTSHLQHNASRPTLFFLDNVDRARKEVVLNFVIKFRTQREKPKNVTFIITSVCVLTSVKVKFNIISLPKFTLEETRQLFKVFNFKWPVTDKFLEVINRHFSGNPMLLQLIGNDMSCEEFMNQEDVEQLVLAGMSRDMVSRDNMDESEQWDKVLNNFYLENMSSETTKRLYEVMDLSEKEFKVKDRFKDPKQAALAKNRLISLIRNNAVDYDPKTGQIGVPPINREFVQDQEEYAASKGEHHFPYQDAPVKELGALSIGEDEKPALKEVGKENLDKRSISKMEKSHDEDTVVPNPSTHTPNIEDNINTRSSPQDALVDLDGRGVGPENNTRNIQNNFDSGSEKEEQLKQIETSTITEDQKKRFKELSKTPDNSTRKDKLEKTSNPVNIPVNEEVHPLRVTQNQSIEENHLQPSDYVFENNFKTRTSSFDDPERLKVEPQHQHQQLHQHQQQHFQQGFDVMFSKTDVKTVNSEMKDTINPSNSVNETNVGEQEEPFIQSPCHSQGIVSTGPQAMPLSQKVNIKQGTVDNNMKTTNVNPVSRSETRASTLNNYESGVRNNGSQKLTHESNVKSDNIHGFAELPSNQRYHSSTRGQHGIYQNTPMASNNTQNMRNPQTTGHFQPVLPKENLSAYPEALAHSASDVSSQSWVLQSSNIPYLPQFSSSKKEDATMSWRSGAEDTTQHQGQVPNFSQLTLDSVQPQSFRTQGSYEQHQQHNAMNVQPNQQSSLSLPSQQQHNRNGYQGIDAHHQGLSNPDVIHQQELSQQNVPYLNQMLSNDTFSIDLARQRQNGQDFDRHSIGPQSIPLSHPQLHLQQQQFQLQQHHHQQQHHQQQHLQQQHQQQQHHQQQHQQQQLLPEQHQLLQLQLQQYWQLQQQQQELYNQLAQQQGRPQSVYNQGNNTHWQGGPPGQFGMSRGHGQNGQVRAAGHHQYMPARTDFPQYRQGGGQFRPQ